MPCALLPLTLIWMSLGAKHLNLHISLNNTAALVLYDFLVYCNDGQFLLVERSCCRFKINFLCQLPEYGETCQAM